MTHVTNEEGDDMVKSREWWEGNFERVSTAGVNVFNKLLILSSLSLNLYWLVFCLCMCFYLFISVAITLASFVTGLW